MIDGGNGLTSWFFVWQNKLTMFRAHCPFIPLNQLAESKIRNNAILDRDVAGAKKVYGQKIFYIKGPDMARPTELLNIHLLGEFRSCEFFR